MKVAVVSQKNNDALLKILKNNDFEITRTKPDIIVVNGGDGTILYSERLYPGIPKITLKTSKICRKCDYSPKIFDAILHKIKENKYKIIEMTKVEASFKGKKLVALNEIQVRHKNPTVAIRFSISINGKKIDNIIGDGVIVAGPFGSTAYYKSAGGKAFDKGLGIVLNNIYTNSKKNFIVSEKSRIEVRINREYALLLRDNDNKFYTIKPGERVIITKSNEKSKFIVF